MRYYFDVYGYYSSDMFVAMNDNKTMLFIPGATNPFIFADNITDLRDKRKALISDKNTRELFSKHFYLYYRQDGNTYLGVNSMLEQIVSGVVDTNYIMYSNKNIRERNVFESIKLIINKLVGSDENILNKNNLADFLEKYNISESDIPENGSLVINLKNTNVPVRLVKLNDEEGEIVAIKGSTLSGIYYEVDTETGYEILSRRVFRTEYNEKIYWTRGGGLKGGQPFNFEGLDIPVYFIDKPYSELASSVELSFVNDDSPLLFPEMDSRLPKPTPELDIKYYSSNLSSFKEDTVILMRGTT